MPASVMLLQRQAAASIAAVRDPCSSGAVNASRAAYEPACSAPGGISVGSERNRPSMSTKARPAAYIASRV
ncbi:hypothetical protein D3C86_2139010 [compost metagenome]